MHPEYRCNLLETLSLPPWKQEQDWNLHLVCTGEKQIPFSSYVRPTTGTAANDLVVGGCTSFCSFSTLPAELQLYILSFCSASTLFQLMHASPTLRAEASKHFWANPNAYFHVSAYWLLEGGYPGYQCCDAALLQNVQNIEIEYPPYMNGRIWERHDEEIHIRQDRINTFWKSVKRIFPQLKRAIFNQNGEAVIWGGTEVVPSPLRALIQASPFTIQISAFVTETQPLRDGDNSSTNALPPAKSWRRSIYQLTGSNEWTRLESKHSQTILPPVKRISGLLGEYWELRERCLRFGLQQDGLWLLGIEALDRLHFDNGRNDPFSCPWPGCDAYFGKAGEWTIHAIESHHTESRKYHMFPDEIKERLGNRAERIQKSGEEARVRFNAIRDEWNNAGMDKRTEIERVWVEQLNAMWGIKMSAGESKLWTDFVEWTSPSWGY